MTATNPRIKLPDTIKAGDVIEVKTLVTHVMETGNRKDRDGKPIPRDILHTLRATFDGKEVFRADLGPGISANPYVSFQMRATAPGTFVFTWTDDQGVETVHTTALSMV